MREKICFVVIMLGWSPYILGQSIVKEFYNTNDEVTDSIKSSYYKVGKKAEVNDLSFYAEKEQKVIAFTDTVYSFYTHSGNKRSKEIYKENVLNGNYLQWYENGKLYEKAYYSFGYPALYSVINYPSGKAQATFQYQGKERPFKKLLVNYWDSLGVPVIVKGNGRCGCYFGLPNNFREEGQLINGAKDSVWLRYNSNNVLRNKEIYKDGELVKGEVFVDDKTYLYTKNEQFPEFEGGQEAIARYLQKNLRYPMNAKRRGVQGKVFVEFVVEDNGTLSNVRILKGVNSELDEEAMRVIKLMPRWTPAIQNGNLVRVRMVCPINYRLSN